MGRRKSAKKSAKKSTAAIAGIRQPEKGVKKEAAFSGAAAPHPAEENRAPESRIDLRKIEKSLEAEKPCDSKRREGEKPGGRGASEKPVKQGRGIGAAVFLPCLFIALVLGLYLGTLLPDMRAEMNAQTPPPQMAEAPKTGPQSAPAAQTAPAAPAAPAVPATQANRPDGRLSTLLSRTTLSPGDVQAWIELGNAHFDRGEAREAIAAYKRALELSPDNADVMTDMGIMYRELGDYREAVNCFRRAREINPRHLNAMFNEGVVQLNDLKNSEEAAKAWERLLRVNPEARSPDGKRVEDILKLLPNG